MPCRARVGPCPTCTCALDPLLHRTRSAPRLRTQQQDILSEAPERFFVAEIIRKHIFLQYRQEVPYSVAGEGGARGRLVDIPFPRVLAAFRRRNILHLHRFALRTPACVPTYALPASHASVRHTHQPALPAVEVVAYKERPRAKDFVEAQIVLEHDRQRGIIIGRGGTALKQLATAARLEIEQFLGRPVYLDLSVKVQEGWRRDARSLERLGAA